MKKNKLFEKLRTDKGARAITLTVALMLIVLTVIIVATVIANRAPVDDTLPPVDDTPAGVEDPDTNGDQPGDQPGGEEPPASDQPDTPSSTFPSEFLLPVSGVLLSNHDADLQVFSPTMGDYRVHLGIDIGTVAGATVSAMADGTVSQIWDDVRMGRCLAIKHGGDAYTIYKNLSAEHPENIVVGAAVKMGDTIGTVGETAMVEIATDPHLHVEMTVNGIQVDPTEYFDEDAMATLKEDTNYEDAS
ncbi:MAG: M23 family metallopeptidase [Clostridia bacterium]|nr:M23 family metallopeptidase [Clostridia bacterium]